MNTPAAPAASGPGQRSRTPLRRPPPAPPGAGGGGVKQIWLRDHPDVSAWTARQLPVPGMHSKWLETHGALLETVTSRDVRAEVR
ncbi:DUF3322 domain-containing protein, partial [Nocardia cyriacigeorgica]|uniref:DUF3322 domain-containing protein n=1 Tax=Nocardia cyriacigeorgica TaxID=135487 RepID=UPI003CC7E929